jgi:hypothetical protein
MACNYSLSGTGVLKFIFDPCTLPDSTTNEIQSHGFINYFIKTDDNLPNGTVIKNKADIYFDYNFPVTTNSTINTIDYTLAVNKIPEHDDLMTIYPNPASDILYLRIKNSRTKNRINIFSGSGINVKSLETYETNFSIPLNEFSNGTYFIQVQNEKGVDTKLFNLIKPESR